LFTVAGIPKTAQIFKNVGANLKKKSKWNNSEMVRVTDILLERKNVAFL